MRVQVTNVKREGEDLAARHQSVKRGRPVRNVYEDIEKGLSTPLFRTKEEQAVDRMKGIASAMDRIEHLGDRKNENYRLSIRDSIRMDQEFQYVKERALRLISDSIYQSPLNLADKSNEYQPETVDSLTHRTNQLMDAIYGGDYHGISGEDLSKIFREVSIDTFRGDIFEALAVNFEGPRNLYTRNIPLVRSVMDITEELNEVPFDEDGDADEAWLREVKNRTAKRIVNNPHRALATQIEGKEYQGRVEVTL